MKIRKININGFSLFNFSLFTFDSKLSTVIFAYDIYYGCSFARSFISYLFICLFSFACVCYSSLFCTSKTSEEKVRNVLERKLKKGCAEKFYIICRLFICHVT